MHHSQPMNISAHLRIMVTGRQSENFKKVKNVGHIDHGIAK